MNTPAHLIFGIAAFGRPDARAVTAAALLGAFIPDASLYGLVAWHLQVMGTPANVVFDQLYYSEGWQQIFRVDNSIVLWGIALMVAAMFRSPVFIALSGAALLHLLLDFPLHNDDARAHFWPLTNWKFFSPVSYWSPAHYGNIVGPIEIIAVLLTSVWLWGRFTSRLMRMLIAGLALLQALPGIVFAIMFAGG